MFEIVKKSSEILKLIISIVGIIAIIYATCERFSKIDAELLQITSQLTDMAYKIERNKNDIVNVSKQDKESLSSYIKRADNEALENKALMLNNEWHKQDMYARIYESIIKLDDKINKME